MEFLDLVAQVEFQVTQVNLAAVLVCGVIIFVLGGFWYSPLLFAKKWIALMGLSEEDIKKGASSSNMPLMYAMAFVCGLLVSGAMAIIIGKCGETSILGGALLGGICWLGFAGATSFATALFSMQNKQLWLINSAYNLVSFVIAGTILAIWR
jgi:hypothetical protein